MQFLFQPLTWGFLLVLIPLLIHLINIMRHRRTEWAAMEFLLESYRKHKRWVWLKQALLIASRMLIVAIAVAMLAHWVSGARWLSFAGQSVTHHYFIIDDSASMGDTGSAGTAYDAALAAIQTVAGGASSGDGTHLVSVIRASRAYRGDPSHPIASDPQPSRDGESDRVEANLPAAAKNSEATPAADSVADLLARSIPSDPAGLLTKLLGTRPTALDVPLAPSVELLRPVIESSTGERAIVYLLSDFRRKDWQNNTFLQQQLMTLPKEGVELQLIDCSPVRHENLSIVSILPQQEVLVAGVPALVNVTVRNQGAAPVRNVTTRMTAIDYADANIEQKTASNYSGVATELPPILIDRIEPGESVTRAVQVLFPKRGSHVVEAQLPSDPLSVDNKAQCVLNLEDGVRVLLIDADAGGKHSYFFESALDPGGTARTGLLMTREGPEYLRDVDPRALDGFACIIMQAVSGLDSRSVENLHNYVANGGGLAVFFGEDMTDVDYARFNASFAAAPISSKVPVPLSPFQVQGMSELTRAPEESAPDVLAEPHPVFEPLLGLSNSPFQMVRVQRYVQIDELTRGAVQDEANAANVKGLMPVLTLRNQQPLMVDHGVGAGRVLLCLTALDRNWTNWAQDPTFVVAALRMVGYLSSFREVDTAKEIPSPMNWAFSSEDQLPEVHVVCPVPSASAAVRPVVTVNAIPKKDQLLVASIDPLREASSGDVLSQATLNAGVYEWWGMSTQGEPVVRNMARNVSPTEGDFEKVANSDLARTLSGVPYTLKSSDSIGSSLALAGFANRNMLLMVVLLLLLVFEQWLAWKASYHLPKK